MNEVTVIGEESLTENVNHARVEPESPVLKTPEWLEVLENKRNRPHKLAHDIGAGAPCLVCKEACKGLNLHFWRKLCIECKCRKEDHEILEDEDYAQFEILFGTKKVKRTTLKFNAQNKSFDWIPPNVPPELAVDYLNAIPSSKLPISDSEGARFRKQQLEKQVPLHDVDPNACHNLSNKEMQEFEKYLDNLRANVIGQGRILKYQSPMMLKETYIQDGTSSMMASGEEHIKATAQAAELKAQLNTDTVLEHRASSEHFDLQPLKDEPLENLNSFNRFAGFNPHGVNLRSPKPFYAHVSSYKEGGKKEYPDTLKISREGGQELRTPSAFIKDGKLRPMNDRQNNNANQDNNCNEDFFSSNGQAQQEMFSSICRDPLGKFPFLTVSGDEVPFVPAQEAESMRLSRRNETVEDEKGVGPVEGGLDSFPLPPTTCQHCLLIIDPEEVVVQTERAGNLALWHAKCFVCDTCKELLVDLMYFYHKGKVYCGRHYAEMMNIPRCYACDELIFVKEYTCAEGESYHVRHFCCLHCDQPLGGKKYIPKDNFPVCLDCYQLKYGKNCRTCGLPITAGEQRVSWKHLDFHVNSKCFRCRGCLKSLLGGRFVVKTDNTFCSKECVQKFVE